MTAPVAIDDALCAQLSAWVAEEAGISAAILTGPLRDQAARLARSDEPPAALLERARRREPEVWSALIGAVSVGETYFFRQPEHFRWIAEVFAPALLVSGGRQIRCWSAGCATGEEAYSLAATLLASARGATVEVLGTDLSPRNVAAAQRAIYRPWSRRDAGPLLHPLLEDVGDESITVAPAVRAVARFAQHNLLDEPPQSAFDLVLCRNVIGYFAPRAAARAVAHLASAVAPGGALLFAPLDIDAAPAQFERAAAPELQIFRRKVAPR
jgi:chemotaxis methyl-accepting protein methylase